MKPNFKDDMQPMLPKLFMSLYIILLGVLSSKKTVLIISCPKYSVNFFWLISYFKTQYPGLNFYVVAKLECGCRNGTECEYE